MRDQPKVYLTRKRPQEENERRLKQMKITDCFETVTEPNSTRTKLTDVNHDCLEKVFLHMSLDDLLNIAHTNTKLIPAAEMAFASKFGKKTFKLPCTSDYQSTTRIQTFGNLIKLFGLKHSLRVLRCFGCSISKLIIFNDYHHYDKIILYTNRYSSESLTEITFQNITGDIIKHFQKPFSKIKMVCFNRCALKGRLPTLNIWFPNMNYLMLDEVHAAPECIEINYPHLQRLEINGPFLMSKTVNPLGMIRLNPQLQTLILYMDNTMRFLRCVQQNLRLLEHLVIRCYGKDFFGDIIKFKRLKCLEIDFAEIRDETYPTIPILSDRLEEFTWIYYENTMDDNLIDFLKIHKSIIKLNVAYRFKEWDILPIKYILKEFSDNVSKIAEALPILQEVNFVNIELSVDMVIPFITHANLLKRMSFLMTNHDEFDRLKTLLNNKWQASIDRQTVKLIREELMSQ